MVGSIPGQNGKGFRIIASNCKNSFAIEIFHWISESTECGAETKLKLLRALGIFWDPFLSSASLYRFFFRHIVPPFIHLSDTAKFPAGASLWIRSSEPEILWKRRFTFCNLLLFRCYASVTWIWTPKLMTSPIINLQFAVLYKQMLS